MKTLFRPALCRAVLQITFVCLPFSLFAQSAANSGQIAGEVLDPSGASIPGVEVSVRNIDTNYRRAANTDDAGRYAVGPVPIGTSSGPYLPMFRTSIAGIESCKKTAVMSTLWKIWRHD